MRFVVNIDCDNDAFVGHHLAYELARILRDIADVLGRDGAYNATVGEPP